MSNENLMRELLVDCKDINMAYLICGLIKSSI